MQNRGNRAAWLLSAWLSPFATAVADFNTTTGLWEGDVSARTFAEFCQDEIPANRLRWFNTGLSQAESALQAKQTDTAGKALSEAWREAYRGGTENDMSIKCLGKATAERWFTARVELYRQQSAVAAPNRRPDYATLYATTAVQSTQAVIARFKSVEAEPFLSGMRTLDEIVSNIDNERKFGAFILKEESRLESTGNAALAMLRQQADEHHRVALITEEENFNRPATEQELRVQQSVSDAQKIVVAMADVDMDSSGRQKSIFLSGRARQSRESLRAARAWNIKHYDNVQSAPSSQRARLRGDYMLSKGNDKSTGPGARDAFYNDAISYYKFGGWGTQESKAITARQSIQSALHAEEGRQRAAIDKVGAETALKAEQIRQAQQNMQKTDAEKKTFNDEADALEAELGF
jgi:hypothetical protein